MSEYPDPGPYGADTDDAISALIDGELAGFAAERGLDAATVRATLEAWRGYPDRHARLERAHAALQDPVPLDDALSESLVTAALAATDEATPAVVARPRASRMAGRLAAAAAVLLVVGGGVAFLTLRPGPASDPAAERSTVDRSAVAGDTGTTASESGRIAVPVTPGPEGAPAETPSPTSGAAAPLSGDVSDPAVLRAAIADQSVSGGALPAPACPDLELFAPDTTLILRAPATFAGRSAEVNAGIYSGRTVVFVVDPITCAVLSATAF